jgi:signal peptidase I
MSLLSPTHSQHYVLWEGGVILPLRMRKEPLTQVRTADSEVGRMQPNATRLPATGEQPTQLTPPSNKVGMLLMVMFCSVLAYFLISQFVVTSIIIQGRSMTPTLEDGDRFILNRWRYLFAAPARGDVVVIRDPGHKDCAIKRIVGLPNEWLHLKEGKLFVNGKLLNEPYLPKGVRTDAPDLHEKWVQLGQEQYYVLGDNRGNSEDSRYYGMIPKGVILGVVIK